MAVWLKPDYSGEDSHGYADVALEGERPSHSKLLGPDGRPLPYEPRQQVGFDLRKRSTTWER